MGGPSSLAEGDQRLRQTAFTQLLAATPAVGCQATRLLLSDFFELFPTVFATPLPTPAASPLLSSSFYIRHRRRRRLFRPYHYSKKKKTKKNKQTNKQKHSDLTSPCLFQPPSFLPVLQFLFRSPTNPPPSSYCLFPCSLVFLTLLSHHFSFPFWTFKKPNILNDKNFRHYLK